MLRLPISDAGQSNPSKNRAQACKTLNQKSMIACLKFEKKTFIKNALAFSILATCATALSPAMLSAAQTSEADYQPLMPKMSPTERIVVLDLRADKANGGDAFYTEAHDALTAIACIQGLVNRDAKEKIYLTNFPQQWYWDDAGSGLGSTSQIHLYDGLLPFERVYPEVDTTKKYPVLSYLMEHYGDVVKGKVLAPTIRDSIEIAGARSAAITTCTFEDGVLLSPEIEQYLKDEGYDLPLLADTRGMNRIEAFDWSIERYLNDPRRTDDYIAFNDVTCQDSPMMIDYWVASYAFCYYLDKDDPVEREKYKEILDPKYYPFGTPHFGGVECTWAIEAFQELGYTAVYGFVVNGSVTSSVPTVESDFEPAPEPVAHPVDPNGVYISWRGVDGDALVISSYTGYKGMRSDPDMGKVPFGMRVSPYLIDLFPSLYGWYTELQADGSISLLGCMNDGNSSNTAAGQARWREDYQQYVDVSNGSLKLLNHFAEIGGPAHDQLHGLIEGVGFEYASLGYMGLYGNYKTQWDIRDGIVYSNMLGWPTDNGQTGYARVRGAIRTEAVPGEPLFVAARIGEGFGRNVARMATEATRLLEEDASITRNLYFINTADQVATYKSWIENGVARTDDGQITQAVALIDVVPSERAQRASPNTFSTDDFLQCVSDLKSDSWEKRLSAVNALRQHGVAAVPYLINALADSNVDVRNAAIWGLGWMGPAAQEAIPNLLTLLSNDAPDTRASAGWALEAIGPVGDRAINNQMVAALIKALQRPNELPGALQAAAGALGRMEYRASAAVPALIEQMLNKKHQESRVNLDAAEALIQIHDPRAIDAFILGMEIRAVAPIAASGLATFGAEAIPAITAALKDHDPKFLLDAILCMSPEEAESASDALVELFKQEFDEKQAKQYYQRIASALAVTGIKSRGDALPILTKRLITAEPYWLRFSILTAIETLGTAARPVYLTVSSFLDDPNPYVRVTAIQVLESMELLEFPAREQLLRMIKEDSANMVRIEAARALGVLAKYDFDIADQLIAAAQDPNPLIRKEIIRTLGLSQNTDTAIDAVLEAALSDASGIVRDAALWANGQRESLSRDFTRSKRLDVTTNWCGNTWSTEEEHFQPLISDIVVDGDRFITNSTVHEGWILGAAYSTENGEMEYNMIPRGGYPGGWAWHEGGYAVATDDQYVYLSGSVMFSDPKTKEQKAAFVVRRHDKSNGTIAEFPEGRFGGHLAVLHEQPMRFEPDNREKHAGGIGFYDLDKPSGLACYGGELFVSDPYDNTIKVFDAEKMTEKVGRRIDFKDPAWMTFDTEGYLWVVSKATGTAFKYTRGEGASKKMKPTGVELKDLETATDLCIDNDGNLLVCDNGVSRQQIRKYRTSDGKFLSSFGQATYQGDNPGKLEDDKFFGLTGIDVDDAGNLYVATNGLIDNKYIDLGFGRSARGVEFRKYDAEYNLLWTMHGMEFVNVGDADPGSKADFYTTENRFHLNYDIPTKGGIDDPSWSLESYTIDPESYPEDPRMHVLVTLARMYRIPDPTKASDSEGQRIMLAKSIGQPVGLYALYRYDGEIAVPAGFICSDLNRLRFMDGVAWPKVRPDYGPALWLDLNGDGTMQMDEYQQLPAKDGIVDISIDSEGTLWLMSGEASTGASIYQLPLKSFTEAGVPFYDVAKARSASFPDADIIFGSQLHVFPETDTAYLGCYDNTIPEEKRQRFGSLSGSEIRSYAKWSNLFDDDASTQPETVWELKSPELPVKIGHGGHGGVGRRASHHPRDFKVEGEYVFVGYDLHSEPENNDPDWMIAYRPSNEPDIRVYRRDDASFVGIIEPGAAIGNRAGALDMPRWSFQTDLLDDGTYVIFCEEYHVGMSVYYTWKP